MELGILMMALMKNSHLESVFHPMDEMNNYLLCIFSDFLDRSSILARDLRLIIKQLSSNE